MRNLSGLRTAASALLLSVGILACGLLLTSQQTAAQTFNRAISWAATGNLLFSDTAPTVASGFGTSPTISASNGAAVILVNVGTGGTANSGVLTMPTATAGWTCTVNDLTAAAAHVAYNTRQTASSTTTVTIENQTTSTGAAVAWGSADIVRLICAAY